MKFDENLEILLYNNGLSQIFGRNVVDNSMISFLICSEKQYIDEFLFWEIKGTKWDINADRLTIIAL